LNPFNSVYSNQLINMSKDEQKNITGLILITNEFMISNQTYSHPRLISLVSVRVGEQLKDYTA
jgi:hypothetical protein